MCRFWIVPLLALTLAFSACGGSSSAPSSDTTTPPWEPKTTEMEPPLPTGADKFQGQDRENYDNAKVSCGAFPRRKVARDLGVRDSDPVAIATAFAKGYREAFRQAAFEGCLAGLRGR